jgi:phosphoadenosine phosphosulfate reductase
MTDILTLAQETIASQIGSGSAPCVTSSFQADCVVLLHMLRTVRPDLPVLFLDTVHHFDATYEYRDRLVSQWDLNLVNLRAPAPSPGLWKTSTDQCCALHKVGPLFSALEEYDVWFTALRREQSPSRATLAEFAPFPLKSGKVLNKVSPLAAWTMKDVLAYAAVHDIPLLPLYDAGYTSIGCEPCTQLPVDPNNPRSGRWLGQKLECGIHIAGSPDAT